MNEFFLIIPILLVTLSAISLMLLSSFTTLKTTTLNKITISLLIITLIFQIPLIDDNFSRLIYKELFHGMLIADSFSALFSLLFTLGTILTLAISNRYLKHNAFVINEFFALILFALLGMMLLAMSYELITAFISLEIASLSLYSLIGLNRTHRHSVEAFFKYLLIGAFSGTFFLLGTLFIYLQTGSTNLGEIVIYVHDHQMNELKPLIIGASLIMVTILFKLGAFLFHTWVLDVYDGASMPIMMYMSATFKIAIFSIALRIFLVDFSSLVSIFQPVLEILAILTMIGGSLLTLRQTRIKRMLAASSIVHSGYLLIALASLDGNQVISGSSIIFYLLAYFLCSVGALGILSYISTDANRQFTFESAKGFSKRSPLLALSMSIFMLSLAGFPSTIGFLGKFYIFTSAIASHHYILVTVGVFTAFVSIYYYFKLIAMMYFFSEKTHAKPLPFSINSLAIIFIAVLTIWGGIGTGLLTFIPGADSFVLYAQQALDSLLK